MAAKHYWISGAVFAFFMLIGWIWLALPSHANSKWQLTDVSGHLPDLQFSLTDDHGKRVTAENYQGDVALLYFGFTGCSTQCPVTMARLAEIMQQLGHTANHVRLLFVTVNPMNDTPLILHQYISQFDPEHMAGLTGSGSSIKTLAKRCRAAYRADYSDMGNIPHSNVVYIFDRSGHARLLATPEDSDEKMINDLRRLAYD